MTDFAIERVTPGARSATVSPRVVRTMRFTSSASIHGLGLLRSGYADHALEVIDRCRIRWGVVVGRSGGKVVVESHSLTWDGNRLDLGPLRTETVQQSMCEPLVDVDDTVALHWDYVCQGIGPRQPLESEGTDRASSPDR